MQCLHQDTYSPAAVATQKERLPQAIHLSGQLKATNTPLPSTASDSPTPSLSSKTYKLSLTNSSSHCQSQASQFGEALVQTFLWLVNEPELMELAESCFLKDSDFFDSAVHLHSCLKTSMDYLAQTKALLSRKSSKRLQIWGIGAPGKLETATGTHLKTESGFSSWAITGEVKATIPKPSKKSLQELLSASPVNSFTGEEIDEAYTIRANSYKAGAGNKKHPNTFVKVPVKIYQDGAKEVDEAPTVYSAGWMSTTNTQKSKGGSSFAILYRAGDGDRLYKEEAPTLRSPAKTGKHQGGSGAYKVREYQGETYYERPINATEAEALMGWETGSTATGIDANGSEIQISQTQRIKMLGNGIIPGEVTDILLGLKPMLERSPVDNTQQSAVNNQQLGGLAEISPPPTPYPLPPVDRHHLDFYESPSWFTTELLRYVPLSGVIGEPCVGGGAIASLLQAWPHTKRLWTNDIDPNKQADYHDNATLTESWEQFPETDWIITNPPYGENAAPIIKNAFEKARVGVVAFLLTSFLEPCGDRAEFLKQHPPSLVLTFPRYCFRKDKSGKRWATDNTTISCIVWDKRTTEQRLIVRPQSEIIGFYKNPDQAISQQEAEEIVKAIAAQSLLTPSLNTPTQTKAMTITKNDIQLGVEVLDLNGSVGIVKDDFGFGFVVDWELAGGQVTYNWERDSEAIALLTLKPLSKKEQLQRQLAQVQAELAKYQECEENAESLKQAVANQAQLMLELEWKQSEIVEWANHIYFLAAGVNVAAMATRSVELAAKLMFVEQDNKALNFRLDNAVAESGFFKDDRDRLLSRVQELENLTAQTDSAAIEVLQKENASLVAKVEKLQTELDVADTKIGELLTSNPEIKAIQQERDRLLSRVEELESKIDELSAMQIADIAKIEELEAQLRPQLTPEFTKGDFVDTIQGKGEITGFAYGNTIVRINKNDYQFRPDQITKLEKFKPDDRVRVIKGQHKDKFAIVKEVNDQICCWVDEEFFFHFSPNDLEIITPDPALEPQRKAQEFVSKISKNTTWHQVKETCESSIEVWQEICLHSRTKAQKTLIARIPELLADYIQQTGDRSDLDWVGNSLKEKVEALLTPKEEVA